MQGPGAGVRKQGEVMGSLGKVMSNHVDRKLAVESRDSPGKAYGRTAP